MVIFQGTLKRGTESAIVEDLYSSHPGGDLLSSRL